MIARAFNRLFLPEHMVPAAMKIGEFPVGKHAYGYAFVVAGPAMAESFLIALISMADTIMVSSVGTLAIAAVGLVTQPRFIVLALILSLNMAVTSITARRMGEGDREGACDCLKQSLILCLVLSVTVSALARAFSREVLLFAGAQYDTIDMAKNYFDILLLGIPASSLSLTISAAQRGIGQTRVSMIINMSSNIVNLLFNYLLIGGKFGFPRLEVRGAAIATVIGWVAGLIISIFSVAHKDRFLHIFSRGGWRFDRKNMSGIIQVGSGSLLEQLCMRVGFLTFHKIIAGLGSVAYAIHVIAINILNLSFCFGEGLGIAASSLVGQNLGAKRPDLSLMFGNICQRISCLTSTALFFVFLFFGKALFSLFTNDPFIIDTGGILMIMAGFIIFGQSSQMVFMGSLRGAGDTRYVAVISLITIMLLRPTLSYLLVYPVGLGIIGGWMAFFVDQYMRLLLTYRRFASGRWMSIKL